MHTFNDTERDAILCGLRMLQQQLQFGPDSLSPLHLPILTNDDEHYPITRDEIDDLCDAINQPVPHGGDDTVPRCPVCGSDDVAADGAARWNKANGQWELSDVHDSTACQACGYESDMHNFFEENNSGQG